MGFSHSSLRDISICLSLQRLSPLIDPSTRQTLIRNQTQLQAVCCELSYFANRVLCTETRASKIHSLRLLSNISVVHHQHFTRTSSLQGQHYLISSTQGLPGKWAPVTPHYQRRNWGPEPVSNWPKALEEAPQQCLAAATHLFAEIEEKGWISGLQSNSFKRHQQ